MRINKKNIGKDFHSKKNPDLRKKKKKYTSPEINIHPVMLEFVIMVTSTTISTGGPTNETPKVEDWNDETKKPYDLEF